MIETKPQTRAEPKQTQAPRLERLLWCETCGAWTRHALSKDGTFYACTRCQRDPTMSTFEASALRPVDALEVLVLVHNVTDSLSTVPSRVVNENPTLVKAGVTRMSGEAKCCAHHGLSLVLAGRSGGETHVVMFDAGPEAYAVARNGDRLGIPFGDIEAVALSHGHWDHGGGIPEAVRRIFAANGGKRVPVHVNEEMFVARAGTLPDGSLLPMEDVPKPAELKRRERRS